MNTRLSVGRVVVSREYAMHTLIIIKICITMQALLEESRLIEECMNSIWCRVHIAHLVVHIKTDFDAASWSIE